MPKFLTVLATTLALCLAPFAHASRCSVVPFRTENGDFFVATPAPLRGVMNDFDGDGRLDIAAATYYGVNVAYSKTFPFYPQNQLNAPIGIYTDIAMADFDHAHGPDLVSVNTKANLVAIAINQGASFTVTTVLLPSPKRVVAGDFTGDGNADFLVAATTGAVSLFAGNGNGTFADPVALLTLPAVPTAFTAIDLNGDGKLDLLTGYAGAAGVEVRTGKSGGAFNTPATLAAGNSVFDIVLADVNGDGKADLLTANNDDGTLSLLPGRGNGTFGTAVTYTTAGLPGAIAVADLTGDGQPDIVVMNTYGGFYIHRNLGNGTFTGKTTAPYVSTDRKESAYVFTTDINGDGRFDLITSEQIGSSGYGLNMCGSSLQSHGLDRRTVNPGQSVKFEFDVDASGDVNTTAPTGSVALKDGTTTLGTSPLTATAPFFYGSRTARGTSLSATFATTGVHTVSMEYSGDENFDPVTRTDTVAVTSVTTSISLNVSPLETDYVQGLLFAPTVMTSEGTKVTEGAYTYTVDGAGNYGWSNLITTTEHIPAGTHQLVGRYEGNATQPPSGLSAPVTVIVARSTPQLSAKLQGTSSIEATLALPRRATGTIIISENGSPRGSSAVDTSYYQNATVTIPIGALPPGKHTLRVAYSGDDNVNGVNTTVVLTIPGTPPPPKRRAAGHS